MIHGNQWVSLQLSNLIDQLLQWEHGTTYPFILLSGPSHIGKSTLIRQLIHAHSIPDHDIADLIDLSDDWISLKNHNDLTGSSHAITINVESKRQEIKLTNGSYIHNRSIRELNDWLAHSSVGTDKVVLIENLERANWSARNALLKTLEEPLPHRLIIATTSNIQELPATIISRAMIFQMQLLSDTEMTDWISTYEWSIKLSDHTAILNLASGRPWVITTLDQQWSLTQVLDHRSKLQQYITQKDIVIAPVYQQMVTIWKAWYLNIIIDSLLYWSTGTHAHIYEYTYDLLTKLDSNVNIDNLLFERAQSLGQQ